MKTQDKLLHKPGLFAILFASFTATSPTFLFCVLQPYFPQFKKIEMDSKMPNLRVSKV